MDAFALIAVVSGQSLLGLLVTLVVAGLVVWLLWWFIGYIGLPEPFNKVARVIIALVAVIFLINLVMQLTGGGGFIQW
jgi:VIT1/CCC1 family predicted Fe2+/Mn2+ transporter